jgi:hypothetical protein
MGRTACKCNRVPCLPCVQTGGAYIPAMGSPLRRLRGVVDATGFFSYFSSSFSSSSSDSSSWCVPRAVSQWIFCWASMLSRRTCSPRYGLQSCGGKSAGVAKPPHERSATRNRYRYDSQLFRRRREVVRLLQKSIAELVYPRIAYRLSFSVNQSGIEFKF